MVEHNSYPIKLYHTISETQRTCLFDSELGEQSCSRTFTQIFEIQLQGMHHLPKKCLLVKMYDKSQASSLHDYSYRMFYGFGEVKI